MKRIFVNSLAPFRQKPFLDRFHHLTNCAVYVLFLPLDQARWCSGTTIILRQEIKMLPDFFFQVHI